MNTNKGRMLSRTGWQGWNCKCCGPEPTKGQKRARDRREWMTAEENAESLREASRRWEAEADIDWSDSFDARWF